MEQQQPLTISQNAMLELAFQAVRLYAETHPRPLHVTLGQATEMLGIPMDSLMKLMSGKKLRLNECGLIPIGDIDQVIASRTKNLGQIVPTTESTTGKGKRPRARSHSPDGALMRLVEVEEMVGLKTATVYRLIKDGKFPKQLKMGFVSLWVRAEIETWVQQQIAARGV